MYTLLLHHTSLGLEEKEMHVTSHGYKMALKNVYNYIEGIDEDDEYRIIKYENKISIERGDNTFILEWFEGDRRKDFEDEWEDLGFID